jgi:glyoxylase-like metal-dependent hydrolase (beta-lactamase superfamily II)
METADPAEATAQGWQPLSPVSRGGDRLLEKTLFWEGYDSSSNIYAIAGDSLAIIDPGNDYLALRELFLMGYKPSDVKKILLTHGHIEHVMGVFELFQYPSFADSAELEIVFHQSGPVGFQEFLKEAAEKFPCSLTLTKVQGGESLDLGGHVFEVIHTPGHTMDSICLYHAPSGSLFSGDTVLPHAVASPDPAAGGKAEYHLFSMKRLMRMKIDNLLPGHGPTVAAGSRQVLEGSYAGILKKMAGLETPWIEAATDFAKKGYLEESLFCCEKERELHPENGKCLELKATCLNDLGRFDEAIGIFEQVLETGNHPTFALLGRGYALMGLGKYQESLALFDELLRKDPDSKPALLYKGMALYLSGRYDEAMQVEHFEKEFLERFRSSLERNGLPAP